MIWLAASLTAGCMDHQLHPVVSPDDPLLYQAAILNYMCSQNCEWQDVDTCWQDLEGHASFCVGSAERLDPGSVDRCMQLIAAMPIGECSYLPEECLLSSVSMGSARACAAK